MNEPTPEVQQHAIETLEVIVTKESVIGALRASPEDVELLTTYIDTQRERTQTPYLSHEDAKRMTLEFAIELAEIYRDSGLIEMAADAYNDAADVAQANDNDTAYAAILEEIAKI
jgi:hypothetical protein